MYIIPLFTQLLRQKHFPFVRYISILPNGLGKKKLCCTHVHVSRDIFSLDIFKHEKNFFKRKAAFSEQYQIFLYSFLWYLQQRMLCQHSILYRSYLPNHLLHVLFQKSRHPGCF